MSNKKVSSLIILGLLVSVIVVKNIDHKEKVVPVQVNVVESTVQSDLIQDTMPVQVVGEHVSRSAINREDLYLLARVIHGEAGVESYHGKLAVGTVVMNRMTNSNTQQFGGPTLSGVIYKKGQFNCVTDKALWAEEPSDEDLKAAEEVLNGYRSFGSDIVYYYNPKISTDKKFIASVQNVMTVGRHVFAKSK